MTQRILGPTGGKRRRHLLLLFPFAAAVALFLAIGASAGPISSTSCFESDDANLQANGTYCSGASIDWNSYAPGGTNNGWVGTAPKRTLDGTFQGWTFKGIEDYQASTSDDGYAGGTKQDDQCASVISHAANNKEDLKRIYLSTKTINKHVILNLAWARIPQNSTTNSSNVGFEFNAGSTACNASDPNGLVHRSVNTATAPNDNSDMLIVYDFAGSGTPTIRLLRWHTSGTCDAGGTASAASPCWVQTENLTSAGDAEAAVNTGSASCDALSPSDGSCTSNPTTGENLGIVEFGEAGIDLTAAGVFPLNPTSCEGFGRVYGVSRTSGNSSNAQMKDIVGPAKFTLTNCATVIIHKQTNPTSDTTTSFSFTKNFSTDPTSSNSFSLTGGDCATSCGTKTYDKTVFPGTSYNVTESDPNSLSPSYSLTSITCTNASSATNIVRTVNSGGAGGNVTFDIAAGQSLECTFLNTKNKTPSAIATAPWYYPNDKATVSTTQQTDITGNVTFRLFGPTRDGQGNITTSASDNCNNDDGTDNSPGLLYKQTVALPAATGTSKTVNTSNTSVKVERTDTVYWRVSYGGDSNSIGRNSICVENINATLTGDSPGTAPS